MAKKSIDIITTTMIISIMSVGGWLTFSGITQLFNLDVLTPIWKTIIGLSLVLVTTKLGLSKLIK